MNSTPATTPRNSVSSRDSTAILGPSAWKLDIHSVGDRGESPLLTTYQSEIRLYEQEKTWLPECSGRDCHGDRRGGGLAIPCCRPDRADQARQARGPALQERLFVPRHPLWRGHRRRESFPSAKTSRILVRCQEGRPDGQSVPPAVHQHARRDGHGAVLFGFTDQRGLSGSQCIYTACSRSRQTGGHGVAPRRRLFPRQRRRQIL